MMKQRTRNYRQINHDRSGNAYVDGNTVRKFQVVPGNENIDVDIIDKLIMKLIKAPTNKKSLSSSGATATCFIMFPDNFCISLKSPISGINI